VPSKPQLIAQLVTFLTDTLVPLLLPTAPPAIHGTATLVPLSTWTVKLDSYGMASLVSTLHQHHLETVTTVGCGVVSHAFNAIRPVEDTTASVDILGTEFLASPKIQDVLEDAQPQHQLPSHILPPFLLLLLASTATQPRIPFLSHIQPHALGATTTIMEDALQDILGMDLSVFHLDRMMEAVILVTSGTVETAYHA